MFFFVPLKHDRTMHGRPVVTFAILALCTIVGAFTFGYEALMASELADAEQAVETVARLHPDARVAWRIEGLPRDVTERHLERFVDEDPRRLPDRGDGELDAALRRLVSALNRVPALRFGYRPAAPSVGTLLASTWMHGSLWHLLGNMLFLFVGGTVVESRFTRLGFAVFYVLAGMVATLCHHVVEYASYTPMVGASGAIAAVLGAALVLHPRTKITFGYLLFVVVFFRKGTFVLPTWFCVPVWAGMQVIDALASNGEPVAFFAHIGGFAFGIGTALLLHHLELLEIDYDLYDREAVAVRA